MHDGLILQEAAPHEIYADPVSVFVAGFIGKSSFLDCVVSDMNSDVINVKTGAITLSCRRRAAPEQVRVGDRLNVMIRPEDILVGEETAAAGTNVFEAEVKVSTHTGGRATCELHAGDARILAELHGRRALASGSRVRVGVRIDHIRAFAHRSDTAKQLAALDAV
jgi:ABC-type Fe3+/spermidine/putrescine transport system ATPase subunit